MSEEKIIAEIITLIRYKNKDYEVRDIINYLYNELSKKENIIKEVREYIEQLPFNDLTPIEIKVVYKILDKGD